MSQWELEESWLVVSASAMRTITFDRQNARPGEKKSAAFVVYVGTNAREATADERKQLQAARKAQKTQAKQRRAQRAAEKAAKKAAEASGQGRTPAGSLAALATTAIRRRPGDGEEPLPGRRLIAQEEHSTCQNDRSRAGSRARIPLVDRLEYFLRSRASKVVVLALVANTMVAQLLYNSAGQLVLGNEFVLGYLLISAICSHRRLRPLRGQHDLPTA